MKFAKNKQLYFELANCIRILAADAVENANSGHPGMPLGMADIMTVLVIDFLKYNPHDLKWFNRDRLILSNGHGSMLLYAFYYLTGYSNYSLDDLKNFRRLNSKSPGHPEYGAYGAMETTTGPLGQGLANAVGMAIAQKNLQAKYGIKICNHKIYVMVGDGCLMEGISHEAASLAGHLVLNNLIVLFDNNQITIDGDTNLSTSENQLARFQSLGWQVEAIDGHNPEEIFSALGKAQTAKKPVFISCRTIIAKGAINKSGTEKAHGSPLGKEEIKLLKQALNFPEQDFEIPEKLLELWKTAGEHNKENHNQWQEIAKSLDFTQDNISALQTILDNLKNNYSVKTESTRSSCGKVVQELMKHSDGIICGSADLSISNNIKNEQSKPITRDDFSGNFIHYGIREHAMAGIMNGLALYNFIPLGGTFLVFSDYMKPAIRLAALMKQKVIYIMTHDSIGVGEDGPTHQPVEQLAGLRAIPNLLVMRPADFIETIECWQVALDYKGPVLFALTRQNLQQVSTSNRSNLSQKGAYIILEKKIYGHADITIFATGSEVSIAVQTAKILNQYNFQARVVSVPCQELFFEQDRDYIDNIIGDRTLKVAIEAGSSFGWHKIIGRHGIFFGVEDFGLSAPYSDVYKYFGLTPELIADKIKQKLSNIAN